MSGWQFQGRIRDSGNIRWADHVRGQGHAGIREMLQKRRQNPGAISRYFNAQKAGPSLDPRYEGPSIRHFPKGH